MWVIGWDGWSQSMTPTESMKQTISHSTMIDAKWTLEPPSLLNRSVRFLVVSYSCDRTQSIRVDVCEKPDNHVPVATGDTLPLFIRWPEARAASPSINPEQQSKRPTEINTTHWLQTLSFIATTSVLWSHSPEKVENNRVPNKKKKIDEKKIKAEGTCM